MFLDPCPGKWGTTKSVLSGGHAGKLGHAKNFTSAPLGGLPKLLGSKGGKKTRKRRKGPSQSSKKEGK